MKYRDAFNRPIRIGDYVVYPTSFGGTAGNRIGRVVELSTFTLGYLVHPVEPAIRVVSLASDDFGGEWRLQNRGRPVLINMLQRVIVVPAGTFPQKIRTLLAQAERAEDF